MRALITGITGQDGSYLAEFLLEKGYEVHGIVRRASNFNTERIEHLLNNPQLKLHYGDVLDSVSLLDCVRSTKPKEIYHLAGQSHVGVSFEVPEYTCDATGMGTLRILNSIKSISREIKFYNAASSEIFGGIPESSPQNEQTPFYPKSPYGAAKLYSYWLTRNYRESFSMYAANGILFNHESPRRGKTFVTRKITRGVARTFYDRSAVLTLGNLDAVRDWGYAKDYVEAMWEMLQLDNPEDFVIATGVGTSVRTFVEMSFRYIDVDLEWRGSGPAEIGVDSKTGRVLVKIDSKYFRPSEVEVLIGNFDKATRTFGWMPSTNIQELVQLMVSNDLKEISNQ